ncbi:putative Glutamate--cysteine ligase catalytic subunit [Paratrimastix pyriformis]|uniref:Glutamate--cysteine ligase n=1 Tax=Paratrimastix pyriformis TaxID=342808 RepID=A0ABQ8U8H1_9EUKA|nr:putative Glutamate--cysteine ligase catalytic subunit [Paratrimastix pyriformis]
MGFLSTLGRPLHWSEIQPHVARIKQEAAEQFVRRFLAHSRESKEQLLFGDECEYMLIEFTEEGNVSLCLDAYEILSRLHDASNHSEHITDWSPEYARYMLEGCPSTPYGSLADVILFEWNMRMRREQIRTHLGRTQHLVSLAVYPRLGRTPHPPCRSPVVLVVPTPASGAAEGSWDGISLHPDQRSMAQRNPASRSYFAPDTMIYPHPRFGALTCNIRLRRGRKVSINVPLFIDVKTDPRQLFGEEDQLPGVCPGCIPMDAQVFGMGCCGLQCTLQCAHLEEARFLYDQLVVLAAPMLALTAASPYFRGLLTDTDCRFDAIAQSEFPTSRYGPATLFISNQGAPFNDIRVPTDPSVLATCHRAGIDENFSRYVANVLARDPLVVYEGAIHMDPATHSSHFQTISSTDWTTVRLKVPSQPGESWRVEFRPMEMQLTDFENAAFVALVVLLSRAILAFHLDFYIPMSLTHRNLQRAQARDAIQTQCCSFRRYTGDFPHQEGGALEPCLERNPLVELTIDEIVNGKGGVFPGLATFVRRYLSSIELNDHVASHIRRYVQFISDKAAGRIPTTAQWLRNAVRRHPTYQQNSVVTPGITADLLQSIVAMEEGRSPELARNLLGPFADTVGTIPPPPGPHPHAGVLTAIS